jgi:2-succinyl-6-hydroxy-2,4-cyclohexadiene-1-carboxylate synthase
MLHGFTQTGRLWGRFGEQLEGHRRLVCVDLPGHGGSDAVRADIPGTAALIADAVREAVDTGQPPDVLGYSLGARVALQLAVSGALEIRRMVVIGGTAGIENDDARERRRRSDAELADRLEAEDDVAAFVQEWLRGPMFSGLPAAEAGQEERMRNTASGLASSLRLCGAGTQEAIWDRMATLRPSMLTVAGMDDTRYAAHAVRLARLAPRAVASLVPGGGHAVHLAQPQSATRLVLHWLQDTE